MWGCIYALLKSSFVFFLVGLESEENKFLRSNFFVMFGSIIKNE